MEGCGIIRIPAHIAVIPDGNRRWARAAGMEKQEGYGHGLQPGLELLRLCREAGVEELTYYGFTTDNCRRPPEQIAAFQKACEDAVALIAAEPVSLLVVGDADSRYFPAGLLPYTRRVDRNGGGIRVNFLVNYGWEWDISNLERPGTSRAKILEGLHSRDISRIDLVIRWGGMRRLSGLLPIQAVYADFFVVDSLWPDFKVQDFRAALDWYQRQDVTLGG